jgi:hypothetical protein
MTPDGGGVIASVPLIRATQLGALMLEQNDEWAVSRRYMTREGLAAFSDAPQVRLPAVAA